jgi:adenylylsulfate kinase-like enzyme
LLLYACLMTGQAPDGGGPGRSVLLTTSGALLGCVALVAGSPLATPVALSMDVSLPRTGYLSDFLAATLAPAAAVLVALVVLRWQPRAWPVVLVLGAADEIALIVASDRLTRLSANDRLTRALDYLGAAGRPAMLIAVLTAAQLVICARAVRWGSAVAGLAIASQVVLALAAYSQVWPVATPGRPAEDWLAEAVPLGCALLGAIVAWVGQRSSRPAIGVHPGSVAGIEGEGGGTPGAPWAVVVAAGAVGFAPLVASPRRSSPRAPGSASPWPSRRSPVQRREDPPRYPSLVIIWLNGGFGAGKTTLAQELHRRLPDSVVYDPEDVGLMLRKWTQSDGDFQHLPSWRELVVATALSLCRHHTQTLIVPMSLIRDAYRAEILGGLADAGGEVLHVFLEVDADVLRERLNARMTHPGKEWDQAAREFGMTGVDEMVAAAARQPAGTLMLRSDRLTPAELAHEVLAAAGLSKVA